MPEILWLISVTVSAVLFASSVPKLLLGVTDLIRIQNVRKPPMAPGMETTFSFQPCLYRSGQHRLELLIDDEVVAEHELTVIKEAKALPA
ncbi:MAG: hypothetical protein ACOY94_01385 [Bacillota bacterium]